MTEIPLAWLRRRGSVEEFERVELNRKAEAFSLPVEKVVQRFQDRPFGDMTDAWREFTKRKEEGDELWFFSSPEDLFAKKLGCQGFAIVRGGCIRDTFVTLMS